MTYYRLISPPTTYPVSLADVKDQCGIDGNEHDARLLSYMAEATSYCQRESGLVFCPQTWELVLPCFPCVHLAIPKSPVQSVLSINYYDTSNNLTPLTGYTLHLPHEETAWVEYPDDNWPSTYDRSDAVVVRFVAGFTDQPPEVVHAVKLLVAGWDKNREAEVPYVTKELANGVDRILRGHLKRWRYI